MAQIGHATLEDGGTYKGRLTTLTVDRAIIFRPTNLSYRNAPDYEIFTIDDDSHVGNIKIGAAWKRTGDRGDYLSISFEDPFAALSRIYATMGQPDHLIYPIFWSAPSDVRRSKSPPPARQQGDSNISNWAKHARTEPKRDSDLDDEIPF